MFRLGLLTVMARNGTDFGIRVRARRSMVHRPAGTPGGLFFDDTPADANPDIGDSAITETDGLGGFAMAARRRSSSSSAATPTTRSATRSGCTRSPSARQRLSPPVLNFRGTPTGIDVRKVVETGILPSIDTGIAHQEPGIGQIGAGLVTPPWACFEAAVRALAAARPAPEGAR